MPHKFTYTKLSQTSMIDADDRRVPLTGNFIFGVTTGEGEHLRVLGLVQPNPSFPNQWRAVVSLDPKSYPTVDYDKGLWQMTPGRSGFGSKREAAVWLLGASDATQTAWFATAVNN
jgi:hypothetical protein